jgi:hypothetical protein
MGAVAEIISAPFEAVGEVVGAAAEVIGSAAQEIGNFVEDTAQAVGNTIEAIAEDPAKALPMIAVAVAAPYVAPYLWAGASTAQAAMVLNTGLALANGADPMQVAQNIGTSIVTQGITANLPVDLSTGSSFADQAIANTAVAAAQGRDAAQALGSNIGGAIISAGTGALTREIRNFDYKDFFNEAVNNSEMPPEDVELLVKGRIFEDGVNSGISAEEASEIAKNFDPNAEEYLAFKDVPQSEKEIANYEKEILNSEIFKDAINAGFTKEEAAAIAKGSIEGQNPTVSNPVAGSSVTVEGYASDAPETTSPITYASVSKEDLDRELGDGEIDQETYDALIKYASDISKSEQEYVDPYKEESPIDATGEDFNMGAPIPEPQEIVSDGLTNQKSDQSGNQVYTYDDGSTLTVSPTGDVVDFTEATDFGGLSSLEGTGEDFDMSGEGEYQEEEYTETPDAKSGSGFSIRFGLPRPSRAGAARKGRIAKPTLGAGETAADPGLLLNSQYGSQLTSNVLTGDPNYSLIGTVPEQEPQEMATGGRPATDTQGVYDLSYTGTSPFLSSGSSIMALKPGLVKPKNLNYELPGYPYGKEWRAAKEGGPIGHNPEFFSEGGLNSLKNSYVKGKGDGTSDSIPAMLANGEFVIPADVVSSLGNGSNDSGAEILSEFLKTIREHKRKADSKKLPPDSKGALGYLTEAKKKVKK